MTGSPIKLMDWRSDLQNGDTSAETRTVGDNELVAKQLEGLTNSSSKYIQNARLGARQQASDRGMLMSSAAAGAGERAAIEAAMPIAQQDAATYTTAARDNQQAVNADRLADQGLYGNLLGQEVGIRANLDESERNRGWQSGENAANRASSESIAKAQIAAQLKQQKAQLEWQSEQNKIQQSWQSAERAAQQAWQSGETALAREFEGVQKQQERNWQSFENDLNRNFQGNENEKAQLQQRFLQFDSSMQNYNNKLMETLSGIYSNPNLTAAQQVAAAENARATHESVYTSYASTMSAGLPEIYWDPYKYNGQSGGYANYSYATPAYTAFPESAKASAGDGKTTGQRTFEKLDSQENKVRRVFDPIGAKISRKDPVRKALKKFF